MAQVIIRAKQTKRQIYNVPFPYRPNAHLTTATSRLIARKMAIDLWNKLFYEPGSNLNIFKFFSTAQWSVPDMVFSVIMVRLSKEVPELTHFAEKRNLMGGFLGNFAWVDAIADIVKPITSKTKQGQVYTILDQASRRKTRVGFEVK